MNGGIALVQSLYTVVVRPILGLIFLVGLFVFVWGIVEFIGRAGSDEGRRKGQRHMLWGVIGMAIIVTVFGITTFIFNSLTPLGPIEPPPQLRQEERV